MDMMIIVWELHVFIYALYVHHKKPRHFRYHKYSLYG